MSVTYPEERLKGAVVRIGPDADIFQNAQCGSPVSQVAALKPSGWVTMECNPDEGLEGRYVSVDNYKGSNCGDCVLTLCEVIVDEYRTAESSSHRPSKLFSVSVAAWVVCVCVCGGGESD